MNLDRSFRDWGRIFDVDNTLATAMIDRRMHHGDAIAIQGDSVRTKDAAPDE
jgi:DNA replication protein DnaC